MEGRRLPLVGCLAGALVGLVGLVLVAVRLADDILDRGEQAPVTRALIRPDGRRITAEAEAGAFGRGEVNGQPAEVRAIAYGGEVKGRAVLWHAHTQGLAVISEGRAMGARPLPEAGLLRVARGLHR